MPPCVEFQSRLWVFHDYLRSCVSQPTLPIYKIISFWIHTKWITKLLCHTNINIISSDDCYFFQFKKENIPKKPWIFSLQGSLRSQVGKSCGVVGCWEVGIMYQNMKFWSDSYCNKERNVFSNHIKSYFDCGLTKIKIRVPKYRMSRKMDKILVFIFKFSLKNRCIN